MKGKCIYRQVNPFIFRLDQENWFCDVQVRYVFSARI